MCGCISHRVWDMRTVNVILICLHIEILPTIQVPYYIYIYMGPCLCALFNAYKAFTDLGLLSFIYHVTLVIGAHMYIFMYIYMCYGSK